MDRTVYLSTQKTDSLVQKDRCRFINACFIWTSLRWDKIMESTYNVYDNNQIDPAHQSEGYW